VHVAAWWKIAVGEISENQFADSQRTMRSMHEEDRRFACNQQLYASSCSVAVGSGLLNVFINARTGVYVAP